MCYNAKYTKERVRKYAKRHNLEFDESQFPKDMNHAMAFSRPPLPVITDGQPGKIQAFKWGLVPFWVKDKAGMLKIARNTPNAMGETIFDKPAFKFAARKKRCIVVVDGFYEYHHHSSGAKVPYYISLSSGEQMLLAGLWESWSDKVSGEYQDTVSIVTTKANELMTQIHNNPDVIARTGSGRMPVILPEGLKDNWINHYDEEILDRKSVQELIVPFPSEELSHYTVSSLTGKHGVGNTAAASTASSWELDQLP